ncbi:hypothetical protein EsDP_00006836 [Epichloe bromicola]|uniref:Trichothecene 3-O-acetyltransferase-like N-terminal domain-containing protein n=1 Tax=Epichloe bromicola TaxID=79588 RepID=A0ABQ0CYS1_9HYPO
MVSDTPSSSRRLRLLSTWNQVAMRAYVRQVFCFPLDRKAGHQVPSHVHADADADADADALALALRRRIARGLALAATQFPHFAGRVCLGPDGRGKAFVSTAPRDVVSLKLFDHRRDAADDDQVSFAWSYSELQAQGFPCKAFVGPLFDLPYRLEEGCDSGSSATGVPAAEVHARIIRGGLLLCFYVHHSLSDGIGICNFISTFAAGTFQSNEAFLGGRGHSVAGQGRAGSGYPTDIDVDVPDDKTECLVRNFSFEQLMSKCPEYTILPVPTGPTAPPPPCVRHEYEHEHGSVPIPKTGRIFRFSLETIAAMKSMARDWAKGSVDFSAGEYPSSFACLAAVTWSFCTVARLAAQQPLKTSTADDRATSTRGGFVSSTRDIADKSHLIVPVSWRRRAFIDSLDGYASNAVGMARANTDVDAHLSVATQSSSSSTATDALSRMICLVDTSITAVDEEFVVTRTAMFRAAPDPRFVGVNWIPEDPLHFVVNSWRHLGADIKFDLPGFSGSEDLDLDFDLELGDGGRRADAVRRAQPTWNMGAGLVLPGKKDDEHYEILVTLEEASMSRLLSNPEWMRWVSGVVE